ncbi:PRD domain-containing protein [Clostridium sp. 19966]|uniref:BglG family transcription antiterminator LicT n=1 Tax=Clostridium sp. 19966 TaxID=2768166 RepID=UPI0028DF0C64|nr:PRD domain-containing protein [Clostridium sp. 19966]MDT8717171.1 PRD domain-containing protein [Clostridium sp. 19966]
MIIEKIINNNVVTVVDEKTKQEKVIMGKGIAFQKRIGESVEEDKIEKIFAIENKSKNLRFQSMLKDVNMEYIKVSEEIISYAKKQLNSELDEHIYIALTDHLAFAFKRYHMGLKIKNNLIWEIQRIHKKEYAIGLWAIDYIEKKLGIKFDLDEAGFIALHIIDAAFKEGMDDTMNMTEIIQKILNIIKYNFSVEFDEEDILYDRLITHLKYFAQRILLKTKLPEEGEALLNMIKINYKSAYNCALKIKKFVENNYDYEVNDGEVVYLAIHIHRIVSKKIQ